MVPNSARKVELRDEKIDHSPRTSAEGSMLAERLSEARRLLGKKQREMAELVGVKLRTWQDYEAGNSAPTGEAYAKLRAEGLSGSWLLGASGPAWESEREGIVSPEAVVPGEGYVALPRYDVRAAAGVGAPVISEEVVDWIYFKADWLRRRLGVSPSQLALIEAVGDSMSPGIEDGDLLLVDVSQPVLRGDGVYVLAMDDAMVGLMVKRIELTPQGGLVISSDNQRVGYRTYEIQPGQVAEIRIVGRVVWVAGRI